MSLAWLLRRLLLMAYTMLVVSVLVFAITQVLPADAIFSLLYTSNAAWPETRWDNKKFDQLVEQARITTDEAKRAALYAQAQDLMNQQVPSVIPVFFDLLAAKRGYVENYALNPRGAVFLLDKLWLGKNAPHRA